VARPSLIYASPFPPLRSGVSEYSAVLARALAAHYDVTLLIDGYGPADPALAREFRVLRHRVDRVDPGGFDHRLYNIGNHPEYHGYVYECALRWPGAVILHDVVLFHLVVGYYQARDAVYSKAWELEGGHAVELLKELVKSRGEKTPVRDAMLLFTEPERLPFNAELLAVSELVLVHSEYARSRLSGSAAGRVAAIPMVDLSPPPTPVPARRELFARFGIPEDCLVVSSLGYVAPTKLNHEVCDVVHELNGGSGRKACYVMVGQGDYIDDALGRYVIKTGFVGDEDFAALIEHSDVVVNLREPSMGETSGTLFRALARGRTCVVNDAPWFAELPAGVVTRIDNANRRAELRRVLGEWLASGRGISAVNEAARAYVSRTHAPAVVAAQVAALLAEASRPGRSDAPPPTTAPTRRRASR